MCTNDKEIESKTIFFQEYLFYDFVNREENFLFRRFRDLAYAPDLKLSSSTFCKSRNKKNMKKRV